MPGARATAPGHFISPTSVLPMMKKTPDVVVLGLPSCGKTVFLSVLGLKYALKTEADSALGFSMDADGDTRKIVKESADKIRNGEWPPATEVGLLIPMLWNVRTGDRNIFQLMSMDVSGESVRQTFGGKGNAMPQRGGRDTPLFPVSQNGGADNSVVKLRNAVDSAKVVCFLINIALPEKSDRDSKGKAKWEKFSEAVRLVNDMLENLPGLAKKLIVVLTQAHRYFDKIRLNGADSYLNDMEDVKMAGLHRKIRNNRIPVVAVSAVNEDITRGSGENVVSGVESYKDIKSDGLFPFLLMVAGRVAGGALENVRKLYETYLHARTEYWQKIYRPIHLRLDLARKYRDSGDAFKEECGRYVTPENLGGDSDIYACKLSTLEEDEVRRAGEEGARRAKIDEVWEEEFRTAVVRNWVTGEQVDLHEIEASVQKRVAEVLKKEAGELGRSAPQVKQETIYGFDELDIVDEAGQKKYPYVSWLQENLKEYGDLFKADREALESLRGEMECSVDDIEPSLGEQGFSGKVDAAKKRVGKLREKIARFLDNWKIHDDSARARFQCHNEAVDKCENRISSMERRNKEAVEALRKAREREAARMRWMWTGIALGAVVMTLLLFRWFAVHRNSTVLPALEKAVDECDFAAAKARWHEMFHWPWLFVNRDDIVGRDFLDRLEEAVKYRSAYEQLRKLKSDIDSYKEFESRLPARLGSFAAADSACAKALEAYAAVPAGIAFAEVRSPDVDVKARRARIDEARKLFETANTHVGRARSDWNERCRQEKVKGEVRKFQDEVRECEGRMEGLSSEIGQMDGSCETDVIERKRTEMGQLARRLGVLERFPHQDAEGAEKIKGLKQKGEELRRRLAEVEARVKERLQGERQRRWEEWKERFEAACRSIRDLLIERMMGRVGFDDVCVKIDEMEGLLETGREFEAMAEYGSFEKDVREFQGKVGEMYRDESAECLRKGNAFYSGDGVPQDYEQAATCFRKAAVLGNVAAQYNLGLLYAHGRGVSQNAAEAVKWYRRAAVGGDADAQNNIGFAYEYGHGVTQNYAEAVKWYERSANQGNVYALSNLGLMYQAGREVERSYEKAVGYYAQAAKKGFARAQCLLGVMYENGYGVERDLYEAWQLYRKAEAQGDSDVGEHLSRLKQKVVQEVPMRFRR